MPTWWWILVGMSTWLVAGFFAGLAFGHWLSRNPLPDRRSAPPLRRHGGQS